MIEPVPDHPLLDFTLDSPGRERLVVDTDGSVRYLILAAANPEWSDRAGLFGTRLSADDQVRVRSAADELINAEPQPRGRTGPVVTARLDGRQVSHGLTDRYAPIARLLSELIDQARDHPRRALALGVEVINENVRLVVTALGGDPVELQLDRASIGVAIRTDDTWRQVWHSGPDTRMFLITPPATFLDGVNRPTRIEAGGVAWLTLPGVLTGVGAYEAVSVGLTGWLDLDDQLADELSPDSLDGRPSFGVTAGRAR